MTFDTDAGLAAGLYFLAIIIGWYAVDFVIHLIRSLSE